MKLRIQNNARGERGVYIDEELTFVAAGATRTFDGATAKDRDGVKDNKEFRVQTSEDGKTWEDYSVADLPEAIPFLAIAKGARGESVRYIPLEPGEWFLGTALASEAPEGPQGYEWAKIGGVETTPFDPSKYLTPEEIKHALSPDYREPVSTITVGGGSAFDASILVSDLMPDVIAAVAGLDADKLGQVKAAENATEKPRKGVLNAIEAREKELSDAK